MRIAALMIIATFAGCAHAPKNMIHTYELEGARFTLGPLPHEWRGVAVDRGLAFRRPQPAGTVITVNATCDKKTDAPLDVLTNHLLIGLTDREVADRSIVSFDGREAERVTIEAKLDGVPIRMTTLVMKKNWCVYDLVYAAPPDSFASHLEEFEQMLAGFRTLADQG